MAQSFLSKYVWIIDTIYKADRISFKELNSLWLDSEIRTKARANTATIL